MAVWQARFELIPTERLPADYREQLQEIVPQITAWTADLEWWGHEDGDRIDVWSTDGRPTEATVRVDLRSPGEAFVFAIVRFAARAGLSFRAESGAEVPARLADMAAALEGSRAARFIASPVQYFSQVRADGLDDV